ncbi:quinone-dependent dihydroorotate dehydrogenase [Candidatus Pacearchaeota archaeon]|nr:quinone-dependent dihydroorotate dehydrogenase [Candidatus Pacearchaeota archaeon]
MNKIIEIRNKINRLGYDKLVKPILFLFEPELIHNTFIKIGKILGSNVITKFLISFAFNYQNRVLEQKILGIRFKSPIGLSAGFDKNGEMISIMEDVGFGFVEIGSITARSSKGNPGKRLERLVDRRALWVNFGLNNKGADINYERLKDKKYNFPIGISVAKTNCRETRNEKIGLQDYLYTINKFKNLADFLVLNISCPNAFGGRAFSSPDLYKKLLEGIRKIRVKKPIFTKISPDSSHSDINEIIKLSEKYEIQGFICTNLRKEHEFSKGGLSGKAIEAKSNEILEYVYKKANSKKKKFIIIGVGGIFNAKDAYKKIKLGADLVQLITGMIYQGPSLIGEINYELAKLLKKDGHTNISLAIGADVK